MDLFIRAPSNYRDTIASGLRRRDGPKGEDRVRARDVACVATLIMPLQCARICLDTRYFTEKFNCPRTIYFTTLHVTLYFFIVSTFKLKNLIAFVGIAAVRCWIRYIKFSVGFQHFLLAFSAFVRNLVEVKKT